MSGGANKEIWSFERFGPEGSEALVLRREPGGVRTSSRRDAVGVDEEAALLIAAERRGVPVPGVRLVLKPEDEVGQGFVMTRVFGETLARRILRDAEFDAIRPQLAGQCGEALARIHAIPADELPGLPQSDAAHEIEVYRERYAEHGHPHPVFDLAFAWLEKRMPPPPSQRVVVHGDFRNGNLMFGPDGIRAVLDWELAHCGDPMEDLGWLCVNSWRFGGRDKPVGGFGLREDLFAAYERESGVKVDPAAVAFWEALGSLKWGIMCTHMIAIFKSGRDRSVERALIGRRSSETEIDLLLLMREADEAARRAAALARGDRHA